ncbi:hypothetical protein Tco_0782687 [Tanacetum coccineum]
MLLAQAQEVGVILQEDQQEFLADGLEEFDLDCDDLQLNTTSIFKVDHVDAFDSDCDEEATASAIFMARIFLQVQSMEMMLVPHYYHHHETDMLYHVVQEMERSE